MRPKIMMGGAMYIRMRGVDLIILCLKFAVLRRKIGPNTLSCTCLTTNGILVSHRIILILARPSIILGIIYLSYMWHSKCSSLPIKWWQTLIVLYKNGDYTQ